MTRSQTILLHLTAPHLAFSIHLKATLNNLRLEKSSFRTINSLYIEDAPSCTAHFSATHEYLFRPAKFRQEDKGPTAFVSNPERVDIVINPHSKSIPVFISYSKCQERLFYI